METVLLLSFLLVGYVVFRQAHKYKVSTPPGPPAFPLIGHLLSFPLQRRAERLLAMSKKYGDIMYFNVLGQKMIVLSSEVAANDLLDKRSSIYSDRPHFATLDLLGFSDLLTMLPYGPAFHQQRKLLQEPLTRSRCTLYQELLADYARILLRQLLVEPEEYASHVRRFTASVLLDITYGHRIQADDDEYLTFAELGDTALQVAARAPVIDMFPIYNAHAHTRMRTVPFKQTRAELNAGTARPCFVTGHLEEMARDGTENTENLRVLEAASLQLWQAGTDTSWATLLTFIRAMLIHPEVQHKAQQEIDRVVGSCRLPDFSDRDSLPYLDCVLQECRRWNSNVKLGLPRRAMKDDVYRGMLIPKGSTIIVNALAIDMDPNVYQEPHKFRPERFLPDDGEPYPTGATFGYGRRICVGRHLAEANIWIAAASILAVFDITRSKDQYGREVAPEVQMTEALISHPIPFKCEFRPRSHQAQKLVEDI